jgi:peptidoglycan/xylan/chitin deacetylase (PgdA/CDA1 family)
MGKRFDMMLFPGGTNRAFTLSYDDGVTQDRRLTEIFRSRGLKCTFNIGAGVLSHKEIARIPGLPETDISRIEPEEVAEIYRDHEVAGHGLYHSSLNTVGTPLAMYEICEDKRRLENLIGKPLKMFAYPFGFYNDDVVELLKLAGYQGARTVKSTHGFDLPEDFLRWDPTCHHDDEKLMELADKFLNGFSFAPMLFYVWGHAYEFDGRQNWDKIEAFADYMAPHRDKVWFATNGEIIEYVNAYKRLEYSVDGSRIYNPSCIDVTIRAGWNPVVLPAGQITEIPETPL